MDFIKDKNVKIRKEGKNYIAVHLFTDEVLFRSEDSYVSPKVNPYTLKRILESINREMDFIKERLSKLI